MEVISGLVLKRIDYRENDCIIQILTADDQLMSLYARGIRKAGSKNSYGCQLMAQSQFSYEARLNKIPLLITASHAKIIADLYQDYDLLMLAMSMGELVAEILAQEVPWPNISQLLNNYLQALLKYEDKLLVISLFLVEIIRELGLSAMVDGCVVCQSPRIVSIDIQQGGFVCQKHYQNTPLYAHDILRQFRLVNKADFSQLVILKDYSPYDQTVLRLLIDLLTTYSGLKFTAFKFIQSVFSI